MKNFVLLFALAITLTLTSCASDDTADIVFNITNGGGNSDNNDIDEFLSGTFTTDLTLDASVNYQLNGALVMAEGTTLTIPAGTTIKALAAGSDVYIAIAQGAKIMAEGTATNPIVITSDAANPQAGDWGGLILLGRAPVNSVTGTATATSEIGSLPYGGNQPNDNSGVLNYVRIEYSGGSADGQSENNGLSFYGVGNGTEVEFIQIFEGKDDGLEFFGGTVNVNNIAVFNLQDDSIDWTEGYSGSLTDVYIQPIQNPTEAINSDKAFECDGYNDDFGNNSSPLVFSSPTVTNVTINGVGSTNQFQDGTSVNLGTYEAIRLRRGTQALFSNIVINGYGEAFDVDGNATTDPTGAAILNGTLQVDGVVFNDVTTIFKNDTGNTAITENDFISNNGTATGTDFDTWGAGWTIN